MKFPAALLLFASLLLPALPATAAGSPAPPAPAAQPPAGAAEATGSPALPTTTANAPVEDLLGISLDFDRGELTLQVVSTGCTDRQSFAFRLRAGALTVVRTKKDECKRMPEMLSLVYPLAETGIDPAQPFTLVNALCANPHLVRRP